VVFNARVSAGSRKRFLAACRREPLRAPPAWVMRQAGRYLPEYRALRAKHAFFDLVRTPELAAELTCQPLRRFDMDAAVIFSDILVPLAAMGLDVELVEGRGPVLAPPLRTRADVERLRGFDPARDTAFVADAIRRVRAELGHETAIIGFCGAPFTTASYAIEGGSSRSFERTKALMLGEPALFARLLARLVDELVPYLALQVEAGADVLQVFDSWGGALSAETYRRVVLPELARLVAGARATGAPVILYVNGAAHLLEALADAGPDVVGIDWRVDPADAIRRIGARVALQGNLDPCALFAPAAVVRAETELVLDAFLPQRGYVFNLGSGILPGTPVEGMEALFATIRERRAAAESE
jgi:uroporphyrinogen decarboxylase